MFLGLSVSRAIRNTLMSIFWLFCDASRGTELNITADMFKLLETFAFVGPFVTALADSVADAHI